MLELYWAAITENAGIGTAGIKLQMNKGAIHLQSLAAGINQIATANVMIQSLWNGTDEPVTIDDVADVTADVTAIATDLDLWVLGSLTIDNVEIELAQSVTYTNLPFALIRTKDIHPKFGRVSQGTAMIEVQLLQPTSLLDLGFVNEGSEMMGLGTWGTTGSTAATSCVLKLFKVVDGAKRLAAGDGDIVITMNIGHVVASDANGQEATNMVTSLQIYPEADGANLPVTMVANAVIP